MIRACSRDALKPGTSMTVDVGGNSVALFRTEAGEFFATQDSCTHEQWSLGSEGELEGDEVVCPLHMARFDLRTGKALCFPATVAMTTYPVHVNDNGDVFISPE
ncbi:non-heme iron oxygenase ferredoxin subunit [Rhodococcus sp. MSC1_016]|jgi:nitrite reductase/ring-hydroxylating ferredoxin subunit|uniref:non-heme iron oxygenase ferredoxin subunit n=1 Tax=Rhodococcus sp. MSC1_016 TaxID=2909266 RepID=UPI002548738C|nr:non-heme iron oxygenase ferredoxin subunit [Rhodococcus sp. MSC1_016]